jgi:hypothetical protein
VFERFTERARQVIVLAQDDARALRHNYIGTEHLLLGLLREEEGLAARVLESLDITVEAARAQIARIVGQGDEVTSAQIPFTPRAKKVLELALREALSLGHNYVGTEHILLGLVRENDGVAARVLLDFGADDETIRNAIIRMMSGPSYAAASSLPPSSPRPGVRPGLTQWAYRVVSLTAGDAKGRQEELTELGARGWQLVTVAPGADGLQWVFQRPLPTESQLASASRAGQAERPSQPVDEKTRAHTILELRALIAAARERAVASDDSGRASLAGGLEPRLNILLDAIVKSLDSASPDVELVPRLVDGTLTIGEVLDVARRAQDDAIQAQQFARAAERRGRRRKLENLLGEIGQLIQANDAPAATDDPPRDDE